MDLELVLLDTYVPKSLNDFADSDDENSNGVPQKCMSNEAMMKLYEMRVANVLCDAELRLEDGEIFSVHRLILCTCSTYFSALFTTSINDEQKAFEILGVSSRIMESIVRYAYLRDISFINERDVFEIFVIADYFGVSGLMKHCVDFLIKMLSHVNCIGFWMFSRNRYIPKLMDKSRTFILQQFIGVSLLSPEIVKLNVDDFFNIINDEFLNVKDEYVVWECVLRWIDYDPNRAVHLAKLMQGVRLGLLPNNYFMEHVKRNKYVENDPSTRPIVIETLRFICDLETVPLQNGELITPPIALPRLPHEVIFAIGGWSEGAPQSYIETYDTRADRWIRMPIEDPAGPRSYHGTAVIGTKIYCIGGFNGTDYFNTCTRFDSVKKRWTEIAPMHCRRCYVSVTALDGKIYALGGYDGQIRQKTVERYDPKTNQWSMIASMNFQRSDADACTMEGKILICGGFNGQECLNTAEYYNPDHNTWSVLPQMLSRRSGVSCVAHKGLIYVIGGFNGLSRMNTGEKYDPAKLQWTTIREMYHPRSNFGLEIIDDMIFAIGGFNGVATISHCECYVPESDEWLEATDMSIVRSALTATSVSGLPNIRDYIHQDRHKLIEERRMRIMNTNFSDTEFDIELSNDDGEPEEF